MAKKTPKSEFAISLTLGDKTYKAKGATLAEALSQLEKPAKIMAKAILTIEKDGRQHVQQFFPVRAKRLFYNPTFQAIIAKQLEMFMKPVR